MRQRTKSSLSALCLAVAVIVPASARADLCSDCEMQGIDESKTTDGVPCSGAVTKMKIPDGTIKPLRDAMIAGGWSVAWIEAHVALDHATTTFVMPGCTGWSYVGLDWGRTIGP